MTDPAADRQDRPAPPPPFIRRQLGHPQGLLGRLVLWRLDGVNRGMNDFTLNALAPKTDDRILEVGFGGGALMGQILETGAALVAGTDVSEVALSRARKRYAAAADRPQLARCGETALPFADAAFTKACAVNGIYFWPDIGGRVQELRRVLEPGGRLVLCYSEAGPDGVPDFPPDRVEAVLIAAGFADVRTDTTYDRENGTYHRTVVVRSMA